MAGLSCSVGIQGTFTDGDRLMVLNTCSDAAIVPDWPNSGRSFAVVGQEFSWGSVSVSAAGGVYRLCWCVADTGPAQQHMPCDGGGDFKVDVGSMTLIGPGPTAAGQLAAGFDPVQRRTCVSGLSCVIHGITGTHLTGQDMYAVLDTCGHHSTVSRFGNGGFSSSVARSGATIYFGQVATTSSGGQYQLCWCSAVAGCSSGEHFEVTAAQLLIVGPEPLEQHRTCSSGARCIVHLAGMVNALDRVFVLDTCGQDHLGAGHQLVERFADSGLTVSVDASGALLTWNPSSSAGGQYRLCWCSADSTCSFVEDFKTDVGSLHLVGPFVRNDYTCVSGQTCEIRGLVGQYLSIGGVHAQTHDRVMMMQTCGLPTGYQQGWDGIGELAVAPVLNGGAATISFADEFRGPGGVYRLCWCAGYPDSCYIHSDFTVDFAGLLVVGPTPLTQDRTCVAGLSCVLESFVGVGLSSLDDVWVLETCGQFADREPLVDVLGLQRSDAEVLRVGGQYRLCWCHKSLFSCSLPADFRVDLGRLDVVGIAPLSQDRTCVSGQFCTIDGLTGHLSIAGSLLVLNSCGSFNPGESLGESLQITSTGSAFTWTAPFTFAGGEYRLCWCPNTQNQNGSATRESSNCMVPEDFTIDFGKFTLLGPGPLQQERTCISGEICRISGLLGQLSDVDRIIVMETCADGIGRTLPLTVSSDAAVSDMTLTFAGGEYRLCWCVESGPGKCNTIADFTTDFGSLYLVGPRPLLQHRTCVSGLPCNLRSFEGVGLSTGDQLLVLDTCAVGKVLPQFTAAGTVQVVTASGAQMSWGETAVTARGGVYRLCWKAGSPGVANLSAIDAPLTSDWIATDFSVDFGSLTLIGVSPFDQDRTCIGGHTCRIDGVQGQDLSQADRVLVLDTCSSGTLPPGWPEAGYALHVSASGAIFDWGGETITGSGGSYRMCWCAGSGQDGNRSGPVCGHVDSGGASGLVDIGRMLLLGPSPLQQHRTCVAGRICSVDALTGADLSSSFLVADTCGQLSGLHRFPVYGHVASVLGSGSRVSWGTTLITAAGGLYRLCWCQQVSSEDCLTAEQFHMDAGEMLLVGPSPLGQQGTCVSGHTCVLAGVEGLYLETGDRFLVLDTCSNLVQPPRIADPGVLDYEAVTQNLSTWRRVLTWSKITSAGSEYRLCWCSKQGPATCAENVDFGQLQLIGPAPLSQHRTCVTGQTCTLGRIAGAHLSLTDDRILVMETCGTYSSLHGFPAGGVAQLSGAEVVTVNGSQVNVQALEVGWTSPVSSAGGQFRLCWCSSLSQESCEMLPDTHVEIGELTLMGFAPLSQDRTCVSGQTCKFVDMTGLYVPNNSLLLVLETCGTPALVQSFPTAALQLNSSTLDLEVDFGRVLTAPGGNYRMCWCAGDPFDCNSAEDFGIDIGMLHTVGLSQLLQSRTCVSGQTCEFGDIRGNSLDPDDLIGVFDSCGVQGVLPRIPTFAEVTTLYGDVATFSFGTALVTAAGGTYQLCWCAAKYQACETADSFQVPVGELLLLGPYPLSQSRTCVSGQSCLVHPLNGVYISSSRLSLHTVLQDVVKRSM